MFKIKKNLFLLIFLVPITHYGQYTDQINSNRPGETMSAFSVGKSVFQVETGVYGIHEQHDILNYENNGFGVDLMLRWGFLKEQLEFIASFQYQNQQQTRNFLKEQQSGLKQTVLGAKYLIYDPFKNYEKKINIYSWKANRGLSWRQLLPAVSVFAGANLSFSDNPYSFTPESSVSPKIMLITQNHLGDGKWVFVTNIIANYLTTDFPSYGYVVTLTRGFNDKWSGFVENQGYKSDFYSDAIIRGGAAYLVNNSFQIDASISNSLKNTPSILYGGVGMSWRFDGNYKEIRIKVATGDSKKKVSKKSRKTKKG
ncbi:Putative MetA-pathway of phenol degradation [Flavobacterium segetis]|uniref:Putative MetA-pathway of phenol degradation n=1 Tax=Flavobacterium segetis TaxID=271157 RepID=A0A1M5HHP3_9FLAO|nr:transporter [Flavobacterium segetis]SHG15494.1 Putative MetA-pathway of phenol degradation [Flavobacterium segetis]